MLPVKYIFRRVAIFFVEKLCAKTENCKLIFKKMDESSMRERLSSNLTRKDVCKHLKGKSSGTATRGNVEILLHNFSFAEFSKMTLWPNN